MKPLGGAALFALLCLAALWMLPACDDADLCRPPVPAGRIQGRVFTGGIPVEGEVFVWRVGEGAAGHLQYRARLDAQNRFARDLPEGRYMVTLSVSNPSSENDCYYSAEYDYTGAEPGYGNAPPDTVRVDAAASPVTIDFRLAGLTLDLALPDGLEERWGAVVTLHHREEASMPGYPTHLDEVRCEIEDGRLSLRAGGVLPGEYQIEIQIGYEGERFWWPAVPDRSASPWHEFAVDSVVALSHAIEGAGARIEGRVTGAWQEFGISPPRVLLATPDSTIVVESLPLYADGSFEADLIVPGPVKVGVVQGSVLSSGQEYNTQWIGGPGFDAATVFPLQPGDTISGVDLVQCGLLFRPSGSSEYLGTIRLQLYDPVSLELLADMRPGIGEPQPIVLANLWPGDFLVYIAPYSPGYSAWRPQWFDRATTSSEAAVITISGAGEIVSRDLVLELGGAIDGRVEYGEGDPAYYSVVVTRADDPVAWAEKSTGGGFAFQGLPDGDYKVGAWDADVAWDGRRPPAGAIWYPGATDWSGAEVIEIRNASVVSDIVIDIP